MIKSAVRTLDEVEPEHRAFYVEAGDIFVVMRGLEDLQEKFNAIESAHVETMAKKDKQFAEASGELAALKNKRAKRQAMQAAGVPAKWQEAVAALVQEQDGVPLETTVRSFLDSDEGEPYRGRAEAQSHFTARLMGLR